MLFQINMNGNKAKLKFHPNHFEIVEKGDYVILCNFWKKNPIERTNLLECRTSGGILFSRKLKKKIDQIEKNNLISI